MTRPHHAIRMLLKSVSFLRLSTAFLFSLLRLLRRGAVASNVSTLEASARSMSTEYCFGSCMIDWQTFTAVEYRLAGMSGCCLLSLACMTAMTRCADHSRKVLALISCLLRSESACSVRFPFSKPIPSQVTRLYILFPLISS